MTMRNELKQTISTNGGPERNNTKDNIKKNNDSLTAPTRRLRFG